MSYTGILCDLDFLNMEDIQRYTFDLHVKNEQKIAIIITAGDSNINHGVFVYKNIEHIATKDNEIGNVDPN